MLMRRGIENLQTHWGEAGFSARKTWLMPPAASVFAHLGANRFCSFDKVCSHSLLSSTHFVFLLPLACCHALVLLRFHLPLECSCISLIFVYSFESLISHDTFFRFLLYLLIMPFCGPKYSLSTCECTLFEHSGILPEDSSCGV